MKRYRRISIVGVVALVALGGWMLTAADRGNGGVDPAKVVSVEQGRMVVSVVATGKIEPITKVEVKSPSP